MAVSHLTAAARREKLIHGLELFGQSCESKFCDHSKCDLSNPNSVKTDKLIEVCIASSIRGRLRQIIFRSITIPIFLLRWRRRRRCRRLLGNLVWMTQHKNEGEAAAAAAEGATWSKRTIGGLSSSSRLPKRSRRRRKFIV
jgi:hypothetical protein